ncbi:MAG: DUF2283 domain-containing protein [Nitrospirae bacterium]|nr:DUF2283 domain-containing protein [Nitrospirota bacterium]
MTEKEANSIELSPNITAEMNERGELIGIEILEASFVIWEGKDVLQIPASALFRKGEAWAVFVIKNKKAQQQQVEIGRGNGLAAEVLSGLSEGEEVIMHPDDSIKEGTRVRKR